MFDFERKIYESFRNKQIYDECCGDGVKKEYYIEASVLTFMHMKGTGWSVLGALLRGSGWVLALNERPTNPEPADHKRHIVIFWNGASGAQTVLASINRGV